MFEDIQKINRLAGNLRKIGLINNMSDAVEIAKKILEKEKGKKKEDKPFKLEIGRESPEYDVAKEEKTVKELLEEEKEQ